jgi:hypothetical protein
MAIYNTGSDAANTAVRAFLTKVGEHYLGRSFNTGSGFGKNEWIRIRDVLFGSQCAYCSSAEKLQIEHLAMFNRTEYGLHHPGNIVPCCKPCNKRQKNDDGTYMDWRQHLEYTCSANEDLANYESRLRKIEQHIRDAGYPNLNENERHSIRVIANTLYENIKNELNQSLDMYKMLDEAFVQSNGE